MIECPPHLIGLLIGRGGSTIKRIKVNTTVLIVVYYFIFQHALLADCAVIGRSGGEHEIALFFSGGGRRS